MSQPVPQTVAPPLSAPVGEEVDVWWGSHCGRAMAPSFVVCVLLTVAGFNVARQVAPERGLLQLVFSCFATLVWLVQLLRWGHRFFTCNYRLTTRYLYVDRGFRPLVARRFPLGEICRIEVRESKLENFLGVGDVWVYCEGNPRPPVVLAGMVQPHGAAQRIRDTVKKYAEAAHETA